MRNQAASVNALLGVFNSGRSIHKTPDDLARYQWLLDTIKPQVVFETGLLYAGSCCWFSERVPRYVCVELNGKHINEFRNGEYGIAVPDNATLILGNTLGEDTQRRVREEIGDASPVLVVLDSDHGTETVLGELRAFAPLVTPGSYCVVEDGILEYWDGNWFPGSPLRAIGRYLAETDLFEVDMELEDRYETTQHVNGWLRRRS